MITDLTSYGLRGSPNTELSTECGGGCGGKRSTALCSTFWSQPPRWEQVPTSLMAHWASICSPVFLLDFFPLTFTSSGEEEVSGLPLGGRALLRIEECQGFEWTVVSESYSSPSLSFRVPDQERISQETIANWETIPFYQWLGKFWWLQRQAFSEIICWEIWVRTRIWSLASYSLFLEPKK